MKTLIIIISVFLIVSLVFYIGYVFGVKALEKEIDKGLKKLKENKDPNKDSTD